MQAKVRNCPVPVTARFSCLTGMKTAHCTPKLQPVVLPQVVLLKSALQRVAAAGGKERPCRSRQMRRMGKQDSWKIDFGDVAGDGLWKADVPLSGLQPVEGSCWSRKNLMETVVCGETHSGAEENELESRNRGRKCIRSKKRQKETIKQTHRETPLLPSWSQLLFFLMWIAVRPSQFLARGGRGSLHKAPHVLSPLRPFLCLLSLVAAALH